MSDKPTYEELEKRIQQLKQIAIKRKQFEGELLESEEKYSGLFHSSSGDIFIHDFDGTIIDINRRALDLFGYSKCELSLVKVPKLHPSGALKNHNGPLKPEYIQLTILNQGVGIHPDHQKKIFAPIFQPKKGNGLGLTVAYSIITRHGGQLIVDSTLGEGTMFTMLLPVSDNTEATDTENSQELIIGHGRIRVMDDEEFIREISAALLEKMGVRSNAG